MAVELLIKKSGAGRVRCLVGVRVVECVGNASPSAASSDGPVAVTGYLFKDISDSEILRRLTQMPDETPSDMLVEPFDIYCPEMNSFVSINNPAVSLETHLSRLQGELS